MDPAVIPVDRFTVALLIFVLTIDPILARVITLFDTVESVELREDVEMLTVARIVPVVRPVDKFNVAELAAVKTALVMVLFGAYKVALEILVLARSVDVVIFVVDKLLT